MVLYFFINPEQVPLSSHTFPIFQIVYIKTLYRLTSPSSLINDKIQIVKKSFSFGVKFKIIVFKSYRIEKAMLRTLCSLGMYKAERTPCYKCTFVGFPETDKALITNSLNK